MQDNNSQHGKQEELFSWIRSNPALLSKLEELKDVSQAPDGHLDLLDDAEEKVLELVQQLGQNALTDWAKSKESQAFASTKPAKGFRVHSKKN